MRAVTSEQPRPVPLRYVVDLHKVLPLLEDPAVRDRLLPLLPEEQRDAQGLKDTVRASVAAALVAWLDV